MSNDANAIISGDGNTEGGNEEWAGDTSSGDSNELQNVSVPATDSVIMMMVLMQQLSKKTKKDNKKSNNSDIE